MHLRALVALFHSLMSLQNIDRNRSFRRAAHMNQVWCNRNRKCWLVACSLKLIRDNENDAESAPIPF
jgi:hypothetical protein